MVDALRRRAWPKLVGLHERIWKDATKKKQTISAVASTAKDKASTGTGTVTATAPDPLITPKKSNFSPGVTTSRTSSSKAHKARAIFKFEVGSRRTASPRQLPPRHRHHRRNSSASNNSDGAVSISSNTSLRDRILASSLDFSQIEMDVARCTWHLLTGTQRSQRMQMEHKRHKKVARLIRRKQRRLANLINLTLVQSYKRFSGSYNKKTRQVEKDNTLRYYQGYHDVACIILSTLGGSSPVRLIMPPSEHNSSNSKSSSLEGMAVATGLEMPAAVLLQISQSHFRDCMRANFMQLQTALRLTMLPLIAYFDPEVHDFLSACETEPFFALSWVITWFSHDVRDTELVKRLFDFFVVSHPLMPIYVSVAMVCHPLNRQDVLQTECDFSLVHQTLSALPRNSSMVGWKYRPGDGYVSDDDEQGDIDDDDDDDESSFGPLDSQSSVDTDFLLHEAAAVGLLQPEQHHHHHHHHHGSTEAYLGAEAVSIVSSSMSSTFAARVPFQELIDTAISYMERMPPRNLIGLATRYYGRDRVQGMVDGAPGISFLQTPPAWTRAPKAKSDQALKVQQRCHRTEGTLARTASAGSLQSTDSMKVLDYFDDGGGGDERGLQQLLLEERSKAMAAIAAGFGPGDDAERHRRKQRKRMMVGAVAVMVVAIVVGVVVQSRSSKQSGGGGDKHQYVSSHAELSDAAAETCLSTIGPKSVTTVMATSARSPSVRTSVSLALSELRAREGAFQRRSPADLKLPQFDAPWMRKEADLNGGGGETALMVGNVLQVDVFVALLLKIVLREALMLSDRIGEVGGAIITPPLKALAAKSKRVVMRTREALSLKLRRIQETKAIFSVGTAQPDLGFMLNFFKDGLNFGAARVKGSMIEWRNSLEQRTSRAVQELRSSLLLAANGLDEPHIPVGNSMKTRSQTTSTHLLMLQQEFRLPDLGAVAQTLQQLFWELAHLPVMRKLLGFKSTQILKIARFRDKHVSKLLQLSHSDIVSNVGSSMKKAIESPAVKDAIRGASIADQYPPAGVAKPRDKRQIL